MDKLQIQGGVPLEGEVRISGAKNATVGGINNNGVISGQLYFTGSQKQGYTAVCT